MKDLTRSREMLLEGPGRAQGTGIPRQEPENEKTADPYGLTMPTCCLALVDALP